MFTFHACHGGIAAVISMNTSALRKRREVPAPRALPIVAYFEDDPIARKHLVGIQRFHRILFENIGGENPLVERVILVSTEEIVEKHYTELRVPNARVLALTNDRFRDSRNDGAVYAYLPPDVPQALLERMVDNALDHIHLVH